MGRTPDTIPAEKLHEIMPNGRTRAMNMISYPLATITATLERGDQVSNAFFDVSFAEDHEEAAEFVGDKIDKITGHWTGTPEELAFLQSFVGVFTPPLQRR